MLVCVTFCTRRPSGKIMPIMARICQQRWKSGDKAFQRCFCLSSRSCNLDMARVMRRTANNRQTMHLSPKTCVRQHRAIYQPWASVSANFSSRELVNWAPKKKMHHKRVLVFQCFDKALNWSDDLIQTLTQPSASLIKTMTWEMWQMKRPFFELLIISHCGLCLIKKSNKNNGNWNSD